MHNRFKLTPKVADHIRDWEKNNVPYEAATDTAESSGPAENSTALVEAAEPTVTEPVIDAETPAAADTPATDTPISAAAVAPVRDTPLHPVPSREAPCTLSIVTRTDVGRVRASNQDTVINDGGLIGVADGMGGHNGGEVASATARRDLVKSLSGAKPSAVTLSDAILHANLEIFEQATRDRSLDGMGTTLTVLWPAGEEMLIGHVGDSRAYLYRDGTLSRQTTDHSMVAEMVRSGILTEEQAAVHPMRNYITRAVGTDVTVEPEILRVKRQAGDRWLVCSDGLHGLVPDSRMTEILAEPDADRAADLLLQEALENGGRDNISLALFTEGEVIA